MARAFIHVNKIKAIRGRPKYLINLVGSRKPADPSFISSCFVVLDSVFNGDTIRFLKTYKSRDGFTSLVYPMDVMLTFRNLVLKQYSIVYVYKNIKTITKIMET